MILTLSASVSVSNLYLECLLQGKALEPHRRELKLIVRVAFLGAHDADPTRPLHVGGCFLLPLGSQVDAVGRLGLDSAVGPQWRIKCPAVSLWAGCDCTANGGSTDLGSQGVNLQIIEEDVRVQSDDFDADGCWCQKP